MIVNMLIVPIAIVAGIALIAPTVTTPLNFFMFDTNQFTHQLQREALDALISLQQLIDTYTPQHEQRVAELSVRIGRHLRLPGERLEALNMAALVHDIGKVEIPQEVLNKPGRLTD